MPVCKSNDYLKRAQVVQLALTMVPSLQQETKQMNSDKSQPPVNHRDIKEQND